MKKKIVLLILVATCNLLCSISGRAGQDRDWDANDRLRDRKFRIDRALDKLSIQQGMFVGEIGAGWGYLVFKLASRVGPKGRVYAGDIYREALDVLSKRAIEKDLFNIEIVEGKEDDPLFPEEKLDLVFMHATIKFIRDPVGLFQNALPSLKHSGKIILIEREKDRAHEPGNQANSEFRSRGEYLKIFDLAGLEVIHLDDSTLPVDTVFVLAKIKSMR